MAPDPANFLHQLPKKESGEKLYGYRSRQLCSSAPWQRISRLDNHLWGRLFEQGLVMQFGGGLLAFFFVAWPIQALTRHAAIIYVLTWFAHLKASATLATLSTMRHYLGWPWYFTWELYSCSWLVWKIMRVRQGPVEKIEKFTQSKNIPRKIMWLQIPPTFSSAPSKRIGRKTMAPDLKKNPAENYMAPDPTNFVHQLPQKESSG